MLDLSFVTGSGGDLPVADQPAGGRSTGAPTDFAQAMALAAGDPSTSDAGTDSRTRDGGTDAPGGTGGRPGGRSDQAAASDGRPAATAEAATDQAPRASASQFRWVLRDVNDAGAGTDQGRVLSFGAVHGAAARRDARSDDHSSDQTKNAGDRKTGDAEGGPITIPVDQQTPPPQWVPIAITGGGDAAVDVDPTEDAGDSGETKDADAPGAAVPAGGDAGTAFLDARGDGDQVRDRDRRGRRADRDTRTTGTAAGADRAPAAAAAASSAMADAVVPDPTVAAAQTEADADVPARTDGDGQAPHVARPRVAPSSAAVADAATPDRSGRQTAAPASDEAAAAPPARPGPTAPAAVPARHDDAPVFRTAASPAGGDAAARPATAGTAHQGDAAGGQTGGDARGSRPSTDGPTLFARVPAEPAPASGHATSSPVSDDAAPAVPNGTPSPPVAPLISAPAHATAFMGVEPLFPSGTGGTAVAFDPTPEWTGETAGNIVRAIRLQWADGGGEARIQLEPQHYGHLTVTIKVVDGQVQAHVQADTPAVREWLQANHHTLADGLADRDLTLNRIEVTPPRDGEEPPGGRGRQGDDAPRRQPQPARRRWRSTDAGTTFEVVV